MKNQRKRVWIDSFQTRLSVRIMVYVLACQLAFWGIIFALQIFWHGLETASGQSISPRFGLVALLAILGLLAVMVVDAVRYLHRFVGPLYRFRKTMQTIAEGEPVDRVRLRKDDFLKDVMVDFNEMLDYLELKGAIVIKDRQNAEAQVAARG